MVCLHINVPVRRPVKWLVRVKVRLSEVVLAEEVPGGENSRCHVVHTRLGNGALLYGRDKVRTKVCCARTLGNVTGHRHVQPVERAGGRVRGVPVRHDEALKAELALQEVVERAVVLTGVCPVDEVVGTHDGGHAGHDAAEERRSINFVLCTVVDV